jgi:predicted RNase H-like nuclease (RuvC/YqgF family)
MSDRNACKQHNLKEGETMDLKKYEETNRRLKAEVKNKCAEIEELQAKVNSLKSFIKNAL